jgi:hypothetical protein
MDAQDRPEGTAVHDRGAEMMTDERRPTAEPNFDWEVVPAAYREPLEETFAYALSLTGCAERATQVTTIAYLRLRGKEHDGGPTPANPRAFLMAAVNWQCSPTVLGGATPEPTTEAETPTSDDD